VSIDKLQQRICRSRVAHHAAAIMLRVARDCN
jgi:hypothetical protein